jgi:hypothetical protein
MTTKNIAGLGVALSFFALACLLFFSRDLDEQLRVILGVMLGANITFGTVLRRSLL